MNGLKIEGGIFAKMREDFNDILGGTVIIPRLQYSIKTVMQKKAELKGELEHDYQLSLGDSGRLEVLRVGQETMY